MRPLIDWLKLGGLLIMLGIVYMVHYMVHFVLFWLYWALVALILMVVIGGTCYLIDLI